MGMRKYCRAIAKDRMRALGAGSINTHMGLHISRAKLREAFRCMGKEKRKLLREELRTKPVWRRVLWGDVAKDAWYAQVGKYMNARGKVRRRAVRAVK